MPRSPFFARLAITRIAAASAAASIVVCSIFVFAPLDACAQGETFVPPYEPPTAEWESVLDPNRPDARLWKSRTNEKEQFRIEVLRGAADSVDQIRMTLDGPGKEACSSFDTTTLRDSSVNGYPRLVWRTDCARGDGAKTTLLQVVIRGREALYLAIKSWPGGAGGEDFEGWLGRFQGAFVCDPRRAGQRCP